ncbi:SsgA family sporulation/cell division regulator [Actinophytocola gossypii]|uniref:SsgA family sporulation/cell division regulator n=1 Tax=Actinophytocola gossypii TaxID=2812003 RepID=A0ABT2JDZ9_9PSEU|nr:SsgA family sporulation/cell division regulator [Actinophytocola gossypii]MCT2586095.1 SsgA family sporulation/cell division regulator [Actinophytocola gossypii]
MTTDAIHAEFVALYDGATPVRSRWSYRADQPFTVTAAFQTERDRWVEWVFSRELLVAGLAAAAGMGDVRLRPESERGLNMLVVEIESPEGYAKLELDHESVSGFLAATEEAVPLGEESAHFDVDALIDELTRV